MRKTMRMAATALAAAVTLGIAAPMAGAAQHSRTPVVSSVQVGAVRSAGDVNTLTAVTYAAGLDKAQVPGISGKDAKDRAKAIVKFLKKVLGKHYKEARAAAKKGVAAFRKWVKTLKPSSPVRIVLEKVDKYVLELIVKLLR
ncbi:hypothetical protein ACWCXK_12260 [Streptomyces sp. NPDC001739]|uniref:Secreted protein n=1 Tax=Streptomyces siderophoricus TaxID=2802281 RepID=A0ABS1MVF0_9ACTN|nr:hypothetical protein [Streptomyces sp. 9-7]MBL1091775.1 hypothetical protein [Streptomyces sp. 9-7]